MSARIYIEGGGDSKELHARCREGFRRLLEKCGFGGRMPRLVALPDLNNMESRTRDAVQDALVQATRTCKNKYAKGKKSFEVVARLDPVELRKHLPSFVRCERVLKDKLK